MIAKALGDVDVQYVWRSLRKQKIDLGGRKSWCEGNLDQRSEHALAIALQCLVRSIVAESPSPLDLVSDQFVTEVELCVPQFNRVAFSRA